MNVDVMLVHGITLVGSYQSHGNLVLDFGGDVHVILVGLTLADMIHLDLTYF